LKTPGPGLSRIAKALSTVVDYLVVLLSAVMVVGILIATYKVSVDLIPILQAPSFDQGSKNFVVDTLSVFVVLELLLGFIQYHSANRIAPTYILDAGLFFVTRQLMIELYGGNIEALNIVAFGAVVGVLGITRVLIARNYEGAKSGSTA
jgi:uncharacterized membrane protein (DUF373 family)